MGKRSTWLQVAPECLLESTQMEIEYVIFGSGLKDDAAAEQVEADLLSVGIKTKVHPWPNAVQASAAQPDPYVIAVIGGVVGAVASVGATALINFGVDSFKALVTKLRKPRDGDDREHIVILRQGEMSVEIKPDTPESALADMFTQDIDIPVEGRGQLTYNQHSQKWEFEGYDN